jgi:hypothetical protein
MPDWEEDARFALAVFRVDTARAGDCPEAAALSRRTALTSAGSGPRTRCAAIGSV